MSLRWIIEPGFFASQPVQVALVIGTAVAVVSGVVGVFTVARGQSFAGHALTDVSTAGGSASFLLGVSPVLGFVAFGLLGAGAMDAIGVQRARSRDLATGIVLGASTGLASLLLYLDATAGSTSGATQSILFGSIFTVDPAILPEVIAFSFVALALIAALYRRLLIASIVPEVAFSKGVRVRSVGFGFMIALALAVGLSSLAIGSILSTALLIGPAATALRLTNRIGTALVASAAIGIAATWLGVLLAYDSFYWDPSRQALPVSFFVVAITFVAYLASGYAAPARRAAQRGDR